MRGSSPRMTVGGIGDCQIAIRPHSLNKLESFCLAKHATPTSYSLSTGSFSRTNMEWNHDRVRTGKYMLYQCDISSVTLSRRKTYCIAALLI
jgi:hypothetical protein